MKREQCAPEKKLPAGKKEVAEAKKVAREDLGPKDAVVLDAVLNTGHAYMCRSGELSLRFTSGGSMARSSSGVTNNRPNLGERLAFSTVVKTE